MKFNIKAKCKKCGNNTFRMEKVSEKYKSKHQMILYETLCHDGFGYDLNKFKIICAKCGSVNEDIFDVSRIKKIKAKQ